MEETYPSGRTLPLRTPIVKPRSGSASRTLFTQCLRKNFTASLILVSLFSFRHTRSPYRPPRFRVRILFQPAQGLPLKFKIHFAQPFLRRLLHRKLLFVQLHFLRAFYQRPSPNLHHRLFQRHGRLPSRFFVAQFNHMVQFPISASTTYVTAATREGKMAARKAQKESLP